MGTVVQGRALLDLPLEARNALDLLTTQAGAAGTGGQNFSGNRSGSLNITLDGTNIQENLINGLATTQNANRTSVDRIEEFRVVTSPAAAELARRWWPRRLTPWWIDQTLPHHR